MRLADHRPVTRIVCVPVYGVSRCTVSVGVQSELVIGCVLAPNRHLGGCLKVPSGDVSSHGYTLCATVVVRVGVRSELVIGCVLAPSRHFGGCLKVPVVPTSDCHKCLPEDSRVVLWTMCDLSNCVLGEELVLQLFQHFFVGRYSVADPFMCTLYL